MNVGFNQKQLMELRVALDDREDKMRAWKQDKVFAPSPEEWAVFNQTKAIVANAIRRSTGG